MHGMVTKYYAKKRSKKGGYGFICGHDGESYFFSDRCLKSEVKEGDEVIFHGSWNEKGGYAKDVQKVID